MIPSTSRSAHAPADVHATHHQLFLSGGDFVCGDGNRAEAGRGAGFSLRARGRSVAGFVSPDQRALEQLRLDRDRHSLAAHLAGDCCGSFAVGGGHGVSGVAAESASRSIHPRRVERRIAWRDFDADRAAVYRAATGDCGGVHSGRCVLRCGCDDCGGLFSGAARRNTRQQYAAALGHRVGIVFVGDHHVFDFDAGRPRRSARDSVLADGRSFDNAAADAALGARHWFPDCERRDLFDGFRFELDAQRRKRSDASWRRCAARAAGGLHRGVDSDGACGFGERCDRLCRIAGAARDADHFWLGSPDSDSDVGVWRSDRGGARGHAGAHGCGSKRIAGWRDDGAGGRAAVHLFVAAEICMNRRVSAR